LCPKRKCSGGRLKGTDMISQGNAIKILGKREEVRVGDVIHQTRKRGGFNIGKRALLDLNGGKPSMADDETGKVKKKER